MTGSSAVVVAAEECKYDDHDHTEQDCCCCMEEVAAENASSSSSCLVVAMEGGLVVVFDAAGNARSFQGPAEGGGKDLCFDHHHHTDMDMAMDADPAVAVAVPNQLPCFTAQGLHGIPEQACVCGVETPHLHAHVKHETICNDHHKHKHDHHKHDTQNENALDWKEKLKMLATQVLLHPIHQDKEDHKEEEEQVISLLLSPTEEDEEEEEDHHHQTEVVVAEKKRFLKRRCKTHCTSRRVMHSKIRHNGTHTDRLVHHRKTNVLTLEHEQEDSGQVELHGTFHSSSSSSRSIIISKKNNSSISVQFYQATKPFQEHDYWNHLFVAAAVEEESQPPRPKTSITTSFSCLAGSPSEIDHLLQSMPGVYHIHQDARMVQVEHDPALISDKVLCMLLNDEDLQATIITRNTKTTSSSTMVPPIATTTTRTVVHCKGMCCQSEIPLMDDLLKPVHGVQTITYDVPARTVTVEHVSSQVSAQAILKLLNDDEFGATIRGVVEEETTTTTTPAITVPTTTIITSMFHCKGMCCSSEIPLIDNLLQPMDGVHTITYDVPARTVRVEHDPSQISDKVLCMLLNDEEWQASIVVVVEETPPTTTTTTFHCQGMCCQSEIPLIDGLLKPVDGVQTITYDIPARTVTVEHVSSKVSSEVILKLLNDDEFGATMVVVKSPTTTTTGAMTPMVTTTTFHCKGMCCNSEVPLIDALLKPVDGVHAITYDVPARTVTVEHFSSKVSSGTILKLLNGDEFDASIVGMMSNIPATPMFTTFHCKGMCCKSEIPLIDDLLKPVDGVHAIIYDVPARTVTVEHFSSKVSSETILKLLNDDEFDATIVSMMSTMPATPTTFTTFHCKGMCCKSEVPLIDDLLKPVDGVQTITFDVPARTVTVEHFKSKVSSEAILKLLNDDDFDATIITLPNGAGVLDAAAPVCLRNTGSTVPTPLTARAMLPAPTNNNNESSLMARTILYVDHICCASEIPAIRSIVEPLPGVSKVSIVVATKLVYVDHDCRIVSANQISDALNGERFGADVRLDGELSAAAAAGNTLFCTSSFALESGEVSTDELEILFSTAFDKTQIQSFSVDPATKMILVVHNSQTLSTEAIVAALSKSPTTRATLILDGTDSVHIDYEALVNSSAGNNNDTDEKKERNAAYPRPTVIVSGVLWLISMLSLIGGNWDYLKYVGLLSVSFGLPPIAIKAFYQIKRLQFDANCLMFFASVGALALADFTEAAAVVFLFALSEWLEVRATSRARQALSAIVNLKPEKANLVHHVTGELLLVPASAVPVGALVAVKTGDKIPCDGVVVEGQSTVDESSLTGESRPVSKGAKDEVSGGTVNSGVSQLMVRTTASAENSAVARLIRLVEEAQANRSETEKMVDEFAKVYTPCIIISALLMCTIPWAFGKDTGRHWTEQGLVLIVVACPCALIISTPVAYVAGIAATAQNGILVKGGAFLESLGKVKTIFFDKTGTLTNGEFALLHLDLVEPESSSRKEILQYLSLMEERASHPVADAILARARNEGVSIPSNMTLQKHTLLPGEGVLGVIDSKEVYVGNERLFERLGLLGDLPANIQSDVDSWKHLGGTIGCMSVEGRGIVCVYCAADGVRPESKSVVANLKKLGVTVTMLTGDNQEAALSVGRLIGLSPDNIKAKLLPEEKLEHLKAVMSGSHHEETSMLRLRKSSNIVLFCGDGVNDAPALAAANVGVAMGAGAALAMETADVTLLDSNLEKLEYSLYIGRVVIRKIWENVVFSVGTKFIVLAFAIAGKAQLWAAIAVDVGAMILVTLNAMTIIPRRRVDSSQNSAALDIEKQKLVEDTVEDPLNDEPVS